MPQRRLLLGLIGFVLLAHLVALAVLDRYQTQPSVLKPMVVPMFTRVLQPQAPPSVVAADNQPARRAPSSRPAITSVASSTPAATTTVAPSRLPRKPAPPVADSKPPAPAAPEREAAGAVPPASDTTTAAAPADPIEPAPELTPTPSVAANPTATTAGVATTTPGTESITATATATATVAPSSGTTTLPVLDSWPGDTRLSYRLSGQMRGGELYGSARVQWQRDGARYQVQVDVDVTLWARVVMTSQGEVTADGLSPRAYEETRRGKPRGLRLGEREVMLANGDIVRRPPGVQDTASQFVELSHRFASGRERLEVGRAVSFWMARPGGLDQWTYDVVEREMLKTPNAGLVEAFHLKPRPIVNPRGNITAEMWLAPSLQYLPVRIRVSMGEEAHVDLLVDKIEQK